MSFYGYSIKRAYDHYLTRSMQVGMFGHDIRQRYRDWGRQDAEPVGPAKRVAFIVVQLIKAYVFK